MESLPLYVYLIFSFALLLTIYFFYEAAHQSKKFLLVLMIWIFVQSILGIIDFYKVNTNPPRFPLLVVPAVVFIIFVFTSKSGKNWIDTFDVKLLSLLHIVRIPVEIVLYFLFIKKAIPEIMTFEGRNFDIIAGISAPLVYYFGMVKKVLSNGILLFWNFVCLGLLFNIVFYAILSAPTDFQQFAFDQPNIAVTYFPFVLLPSVIVPIVMFSHLVIIRKLVLKK